jgi:hypothetical protein
VTADGHETWDTDTCSSSLFQVEWNLESLSTLGVLVMTYVGIRVFISDPKILLLLLPS